MVGFGVSGDGLTDSITQLVSLLGDEFKYEGCSNLTRNFHRFSQTAMWISVIIA
jgi:hypothetical protein